MDSLDVEGQCKFLNVLVSVVDAENLGFPVLMHFESWELDI